MTVTIDTLLAQIFFLSFLSHICDNLKCTDSKKIIVHFDLTEFHFQWNLLYVLVERVGSKYIHNSLSKFFKIKLLLFFSEENVEEKKYSSDQEMDDSGLLLLLADPLHYTGRNLFERYWLRICENQLTINIRFTDNILEWVLIKHIMTYSLYQQSHFTRDYFWWIVWIIMFLHNYNKIIVTFYSHQYPSPRVRRDVS